MPLKVRGVSMMRFRHVVGALAMVALAGSLALAQAPGWAARRSAPRTPQSQGVAGFDHDGEHPADHAELLGGARHQLRLLPRLDGPGPADQRLRVGRKAGEGSRPRDDADGRPESTSTLAADIKKPADQLTRVQCMTCHRGAAIPTLPPPAPAGAAPAAGASAGAEVKRRLRQTVAGDRDQVKDSPTPCPSYYRD